MIVNKEITSCRVDIGNVKGEEFALHQVLINSPDVVTYTIPRTINLKIFQNFITYLLVLVCGTVLFFRVVYKLNSEKTYAFLACGIGLLYLFVIAPLSVPDEPHHYQSSYQLSNYLLFQESEYGDSSDFNYSQYVGHNNVSSGYNRIVADFGKPSEAGNRILIPQPRDLSYFIEYLPQALGIVLCRTTNQNFTTTFLIGRFFNLLFYSSCVYCAVKRTPKFKTMFGLVGIMPMALHQAASFSYDGFVNGMSLVLISSILKGIYEEGWLPVADYIWIVVTGALLAPAKIVYSSILILIFLIPSQRFSGRGKWIKGIALIFFISFCTILIFNFSRLISLAVPDSNALNWAGEHNYTWEFILHHPWKTLTIFIKTFTISIIGWIRGAIGTSMSGLTLPLPGWISLSYIGLFFFSSLLETRRSTIEVELIHKIFFILVSLSVIALVMLSLFIGWTSDSSDVILGVQGRYFIPIIPLLVMTLSNNLFIVTRNIDKVIISGSVLLNISTLVHALNYTLAH